MAKKLKQAFLIVLFSTQIVVYGATGNQTNKLQEHQEYMDNQKALEIATQEAARLGYKPDEMNVLAGDENEVWSKHLGFDPSWKTNNEMKRFIEQLGRDAKNGYQVTSFTSEFEKIFADKIAVAKTRNALSLTWNKGG